MTFAIIGALVSVSSERAVGSGSHFELDSKVFVTALSE